MKKGLAILLTLIMLVTMQSVTASAASFTDTVGESCEVAVDVLSALEIVEGKTADAYQPNGALTRAEMTTIILRTIGMADSAEGADIFEDVPFTHWAYGNITTAYQMGIVQGTSATTFDPDATVTREQAVKMVVATLGYSVAAESMGGYPSGYMTKAIQLELLKGVNAEADMTRGDMAILLYNALDVPLFEKEVYGNDSYKYGTDEEVTLLTRYLKVKKMAGKVVQTPMACADSDVAKLLSDEVRVSNGTSSIVMKKGKTTAEDYLGYRAEFIYREDETLEVAVKDVVAGKTTNTELVYEKDGDEKKENIQGATLVYNGRVRAMDAALLKPEVGTLRLVSEAGGAYDLVIVESYTNYIVERADAENDVVYFKDGAGVMEIKVSDSNVNTLVTDETGKLITLNDIAEWDVLSIYTDRADNPSLFRVYRSRKTVDGEITEYSATANEVVIGGETYAVSSTVTEELAPGDKILCYMDFTGTVVFVEESKGSGRTYGWLKAAEESKGLEPVVQLKVFTQDGEWVVFKVAKKMELNGVPTDGRTILDPGTASENMYLYNTRPTLTNSEGTIEPQLIAYETNEEGLITKIETAFNMSKPSVSIEEKFGGEFSMDYYQNTGLNVSLFNGTPRGDESGSNYVSGTFHRYGYLSFENVAFTRVRVRPETKYFVIPGNTANEKAYEVKTATAEIKYENVHNTHTLDCLTYFDVSEDYVLGAAVLRKDIKALEAVVDDSTVTYPGYTIPAGVVLNRGKKLTEDGMTVDVLTVYNQNGQEVTLDLANVERVQYRNANARMFDVVEGDTTLPADPAWYMLRDDETKYRPAQNTNDWKNEKNTSRHKSIFMDIEDIVPGDIVQYDADEDGNLYRLCMVYRCEYPGKVEFASREDWLGATGPDVRYRGGNMTTNGEVTKIFEDGILVEVGLTTCNSTDAIGRHTPESLALPSGIITNRMLPKTGKFVLWDSSKQQMTAITASDIVIGDTVLSWWATINQRMVVVYR